MKIEVTYEEEDLKRLIRADLARQGIPATDADVKLTKGKATVSVEVTGNESSMNEPTPEQRNNHTHDVMTRPEVGRPPAPPAPPPLEVVEGGANPVDMSDVFRQSQKIAATKEGKFPVPERQLMQGESFDFPGDE